MSAIHGDALRSPQVERVVAHWAMCEGPPALVVTRAGRVMQATHRAVAMLQAAACVRLVNERLHFAKDADAAAFEALAQNGAAGTVLIVREAAMSCQVSLRMSARYPEEQGLAIITLAQETGERWPREFGLTPREGEVLSQLLHGHTVPELAAAGGSSIATIRSHIRGIYSKLEVRSREQLFYKLRNYLPLAAVAELPMNISFGKSR